jgi:hypothetical protein
MSTHVIGARLQGVKRSFPGAQALSAACHSVEPADSESNNFSLRRPRSGKGSLCTDEANICELNSQQSPRSPLDVATSLQCADSVGSSVRADIDAAGYEVANEASQYCNNGNAAPTVPPQTSNKRRAPASAAPRQAARYNSAAASAAPDLVNQPRTTLISAQLEWYDGRQRRSSTSTAQCVPQSRTDTAAPYRAGAAAGSRTVANAITELDRPSHWNRSVPTKASSPQKRSRLRAPTSGATTRSAETFSSVPQQSPKVSKRSRTQHQHYTYHPGGEMIADGISLAESFKSASLPKTIAAASTVLDIKSVSFKPSFFEQDLVTSQAAAEDITSDCDNDRAHSNNADDCNRTRDDTATKGLLVSPSKSSSWRPAFDSSISSNTAQLSPQSGRVNKRHRSSSKPGGPISQLLQRLRTRYEGDAARLLSGEYPFRLGRVDLSDPRSRCLCAIDVTVLQQCSTAVASTTHLNVLCYVHQVSTLKHSAQAPIKQQLNDDDTTDAAQAVYMQHMNECLPKAVVKLILRADANNTLRLGYGVQLRVYDPLLLHAVSHNGSTSQSVMTADLCETYPSQQLQALSTPPTYNM